MKKAQNILAYFFGTILVLGAINHIVQPAFYSPVIPSFISETMANILSAIAEAIIGIMLFIPKYRKLGALGFAILMIIFLPIHIWDYTKEVPAIGGKTVAMIRLILQILFIVAGWWIYKKRDAENPR